MIFIKVFILIATFSSLCKPDVLDQLPILVTPPAIVWLESLSKNITLPCSTVVNDPHAWYAWEKNGDILNVKSNPNIITNKDNGTIVILKPTDEDIGRYQCYVEWNLKVATSAMIDIYKTYLYTTKNVEKHKAVDGKAIHLDCPVEANPYPTFEWKLMSTNDPRNFTDIKKDHIVVPDGSLWLFNVTKEDALKNTSYICFVTSKVTNLTEIAAEHQIEDVEDNDKVNKHLEELYTSGDKLAEVGKVTELYCIFSGSPSPNVTWLKDNKRIHNSTNRITIDKKNRGQVLVINDTKVEDEGVYTCIIKNKVNVPRRHHIEVTVVMPPTFENKTPPVIKVIEGTDVTITFSIKARPEPIILWTVDSQPLSEGSPRMESTTIFLDGEPTRSHLTIKNVDQEHTGYYGCRAFNIYGEMYRETLLHVMSI